MRRFFVAMLPPFWQIEIAMADRDHTLRINRAHKHLQDLSARAAEWRNGRHYSLRQSPDPNQLHNTFVIEAITIRPPADPFSLLIAECLNGMRSSLDLLAYELAVKHTGDPLPQDIAEDSEFPIYGDIDKSGRAGVGANLFRDNGRPKVRGINPTAQTEIERLQPYHDGTKFNENLLWILHNLDRINKHRLLHPIMASTYGVKLDSAASRNVRAITNLVGYRASTMTMAYKPIAHATVIPDDPNQQVHLGILPALQVAFEEGVPDVELEPVTTELDRIYNFLVTRVFSKLEPFL